MKPYYVNTNKNVKPNGRKAIPISTNDFKEKLVKALRKAYVEEEYEDVVNKVITVEAFDNVDDAPILNAIVALRYYNETIEKDIKVNVDFENVDYCLYDDVEYVYGGYENIIGFHTLPNGLTYFGFIAGGDWEFPVFMILYFDGKKIRLYVPTCGNTYNVDEMCAFGSEEETTTADYIRKNCEENIEDIDDDELLSDLCLNVQKILYDISTHIQVI